MEVCLALISGPSHSFVGTEQNEDLESYSQGGNGGISSSRNLKLTLLSSLIFLYSEKLGGDRRGFRQLPGLFELLLSLQGCFEKSTKMSLFFIFFRISLMQYVSFVLHSMRYFL